MTADPLPDMLHFERTGARGGFPWPEIPASGWHTYIGSARGVTLYVGISRVPRSRLQDHRGSWLNRADALDLLPAPDEFEARYMEAWLIQRLRPQVNRKLSNADRGRLRALGGTTPNVEAALL